MGRVAVGRVVEMSSSVSKTGVPIVADTQQLARLARDLRASAPEAWVACRAGLRTAGNIVAADARVRAESFSTRIPRTIKVRTTTGANVKVSAGGEDAPHAPAFEHKGVPGPFRHPVYGNRNVWVSQESHPFLGPALAAHQTEVIQAVEDAVVGAVERALTHRV